MRAPEFAGAATGLRTRRRLRAAACIVAMGAASAAQAQDLPPPDPSPDSLAASIETAFFDPFATSAPALPTRAAFARTRGVALQLTSSGIGLGTARSAHIGGVVSLVTEVVVGGIRDERETKYAGLGGTAIQAKRTFVAAVPLRAGLAVRVFERSVAPNVRPYIVLAGGPTFAWAYPYFGDCNANGNLDPSTDCDADGVVMPGEGERPLGFFEAQRRGRILIGAGGLVGAGAHIGWGRRVQGVRLAYRLDVFPTGVALLEARVRGRQRVFGSPEITLTFGRLW